jgi:hypothetical protein
MGKAIVEESLPGSAVSAKEWLMDSLHMAHTDSFPTVGLVVSAIALVWCGDGGRSVRSVCEFKLASSISCSSGGRTLPGLG